MTLLARRKPHSIALILALAISLGAVFLSPGRATAGWIEQQNCGSRPGGPIVLYWGLMQSGAYICVNGTISDMAGNGSGGCCDSRGTPARVVAVLRSWSECVAAKGYKYPDPFAAAGAFNIVSSPPTSAEIRAAVADVACKSETNLLGVWHTVETAYQNAAVQQYLAELTAIKARTDLAVGKAVEIVAAGSSSR